MPSVLVDTGVWYSFFDARDRPDDRENVEALAELIAQLTVVIPWPVTYETIRTRFTKNKEAMAAFERKLKSSNIEFLDDTSRRCLKALLRVVP
jgi:predicted nucleic acid-binding protein